MSPRRTKCPDALLRLGPLPHGRGTDGLSSLGLQIVFALYLLGCACVHAQPPQAVADVPAEELRLDPAVFRAGLKKLGLNEVLELHLRAFPPSDEVDRLLMTRDIRMAEFHDGSLPVDDRRRAAEEANTTLERLIADHADDARRLDWTFELARSLIYDQAESDLTRLLYQESPPMRDDRLSALTSRAVALTGRLLREIDQEYARIDALPADEFDSLEQDGFVERLDALAPRARYLRAWALFYDSFHRVNADPRKASQLHELRGYFRDNPQVLGTPHAQSHVQVQALLLAGMTARSLQDQSTSQDVLRRALSVAESLDESERRRVGWAESLAWLELSRSLRDAQRFDKALAAHTQLMRLATDEGQAGFGLRLAAAFLERSVWRAKSRQAKEAGDADAAQRFYARSWKAVASLVEREPQRRDEIYAAVCESMGLKRPVQDFDPMELCSGVAGAILDATDDPQRADEWLLRAMELAERFIADHKSDARVLTPDVLFNLAVVHLRLGESQAAARRFLEVARDYPAFDQSYRAVTAAAQLLATDVGTESDLSNDSSRAVYRQTLELLLNQYPGTEAEQYWRFFYAQLLGRSDEHESAAAQYALVDPGHERYVESVFLRLQERAITLGKRVKDAPDDLYAIRESADEISRLERDLIALVLARPDLRKEDERAALIDEMLARARVIKAETKVLPQVNRSESAVDMLIDFEARFPDRTELLSRVWRVRLIGLERLGRLQEAMDSIPAYIERDSEGAGRTLQLLYDAMASELDPFDARRADPVSISKTQIAMLLAKQLSGWADRRGALIDEREKRRIRLQLGEALLSAGAYVEARTEFEALAAIYPEAVDVGSGDAGVGDLRLTYGLAEARFQTKAFEKALPLFNRLATRLDPRDAIRWWALLRDLQCRVGLDEAPEGIIKVIDQQRFLFPELGGPRLAEEFERLLRESQRKLDASAGRGP